MISSVHNWSIELNRYVNKTWQMKSAHSNHFTWFDGLFLFFVHSLFFLLIFFWENRKKPKIFIMYTWIITSHFKKSNEKCKTLINIYKTKSVINNITKSSLKILPPKKIKTGNVIYINLHILVLYLNNIILNRHWHIKFKTNYIRIRKAFSFLFIESEWKGMILWEGIYG